MKNLIIALFIVSVAFCAMHVQASIDTDDAMKNPGLKVTQNDTFGTVSLSTTVASTTAVTQTALTGRDYIEIRAGAIAGQEIWVGIDTTPTVGTGLCATPDNPVKLNLGASNVVKTIASGAFPMAVFQAAY